MCYKSSYENIFKRVKLIEHLFTTMQTLRTKEIYVLKKE